MPAHSRIDSAHAVFARTAIILFVLIAWLGVSISTAHANVPRAYAGIVVDAKTGQVLYQDNANELRYPASLTKVMTLYILFQELEAGRLRLDSKLSVSAHAAAAVPTKLYVQRGSTIKVEDAIKSLVTLSANDVARVIGENISGTESKFAERMTQTARALGMSRTTYKNASGLPDSGQVTTAADQATLARAIYLHFPTYYEYFQTRSFTYGGKTYGNHNRLLGQNGVDGIKTGYINASGYNLMTAARANNRHVVAIGLGFNTGAARNAHVAKLVRDYMPKARRGDYWREAMISRPTLLGNGIAVAAARVIPLDGLPPERPATLYPQPAFGDPVQVAAIAPAASPAQPVVEDIPFQVVAAEDIPQRPGSEALDQATYVATGVMPQDAPQYPTDDPIGAWIAETMKLGPSNSDVGSLQPGQVLVPPAPIARPEGLAVDLMSTNSADTTPAGGWVVQIGASANEEDANALLQKAAEKHDALANLRSYVEPFENNGQTFYRARFAGFADRSQARLTCDALTGAQMNCLAVQG